MVDLRAFSTTARRLTVRHRRVLGALLAALAVLVLVETLSPATPSLQAVVMTARDVRSGTTLAGSDLTVQQVPRGLVPSGAASALGEVLGRVVAGPMRAGETVTDRRLLGRSLLSGYPPGLVATPVRIRDAPVVDLLQVGDEISVYAAGRDASYADLVVERVPVVTLPQVDDQAQQGGLVVLAVTAQQAAALAEASATAPLSVALLR